MSHQPARRSSSSTLEEPGFGRWRFWKRWFGQRSERAAAKYLRNLGYRIVAANVTVAHGELDLIAIDGTTIVIIEVRSTATDDPARPAASVDFVKQKKLTQAALRYLQAKGLLGANVRFDVLAIAWPEGQNPEFLHIPQAFEPTDRFQMFS
jgi:putative endonuclease